MNINIIIEIIESLTSDLSKIEVLKKNLNKLEIIEKNDIVRILSTIQSDNYKIDVIKTLILSCPFSISSVMMIEMMTDLTSILSCIRSDNYKIDAVKILIKYYVSLGKSVIIEDIISVLTDIHSDNYKIDAIRIFSMYYDFSAEDINSILASINSDNYRCDALNALLPNTKLINHQTVSNILTSINNDNYKIDAMKVIIKYCNTDKVDIIRLITCLSSDSYRTQYVKHFLSRMELQFDDIIWTLQEINSDNYRCDTLILLENKLTIISEKQFLDIFQVIKTNHFRQKVIDSLLDKITVTDYQTFCKNLVDIFDLGMYNYITEKLAIDKSITDQYKPIEKVGSINPRNCDIFVGQEYFGGVVGNVIVEPGVTYTSSTVITDKYITEIRNYSNGNVVRYTRSV